MDIATAAQLLSSLATFVVALGILYQGRQARKARDDQDRPQIIVDADYTGRFTTNIVVRNIGHGMAKNITFEFSAPLQSTSGADITELPYFKNGINFMAPQTDIAAVWDSYQKVVQNLRDIAEFMRLILDHVPAMGEPAPNVPHRDSPERLGYRLDERLTGACGGLLQERLYL
jgi:hypothetical protein